MVPTPNVCLLLILGMATCSSLLGDLCKGDDCHLIDDIANSESASSFLQVSRKVQNDTNKKPVKAAPAEAAAPVEEMQSSELSLSDIPKFVISTAKHGKRTLPFVKEVQKYGDTFKSMCRVQAVVASQCKLFWHGKLELGAASVSTSHMKIWQHMVDDRIPVALVVEDDAFGVTAPNFIPLLQKALDRYKSYDIFRVSRIPVPTREALQNQVHASILQHQAGKPVCRRGLYGTQLYIMTLAGAKFALENFQFGAHKSSLDVFEDIGSKTVYSNLDSFRIECFNRGIMRFMDDAFGDFRDREAHAEAREQSEKAHPESITSNETLSFQDHQLIREVLPDCRSGGILMEPCANYVDGLWVRSDHL
mmetsp:Transcript_115522/g.222600  ORF Transcript_115522/g.222600 Transcript_115522/m.222600 type:complete len:363 (-) Transcript_115522:56-1144(-)